MKREKAEALTLANLLAYIADKGIDPKEVYLETKDGNVAREFEFLRGPFGENILTIW